MLDCILIGLVVLMAISYLVLALRKKCRAVSTPCATGCSNCNGCSVRIQEQNQTDNRQ